MPDAVNGLGGELSAADVVELRVGLSGLTAEVHRMRADLAPLAVLPTQLQAATDLLTERLSGEVKARQRAVEQERDARVAAIADLRADVEKIERWVTWAVQLVLGAVGLAIIDVVTGPATGVL